MKSIVDKMVERFLGWRLPKDFHPDNGISFKSESDYDHPEFGRTKYEPTGTNLFHAGQAKQMFEEIVLPLLPPEVNKDATPTKPQDLTAEKAAGIFAVALHHLIKPNRGICVKTNVIGKYTVYNEDNCIKINIPDPSLTELNNGDTFTITEDESKVGTVDYSVLQEKTAEFVQFLLANLPEGVDHSFDVASDKKVRNMTMRKVGDSLSIIYEEDRPTLEDWAKEVKAVAAVDNLEDLEDMFADQANGVNVANIETTSGKPITPATTAINPATGMQNDYIVLSAEERAKGYVRPLRNKYIHTKCCAVTKINQAIAETYASVPSFYDQTYCCYCKKHYPVSEFLWDGTNQKLGS